MTTLIDGVVCVAGVCSYICKLGTFFVMLLTLITHANFRKKYLCKELWKNLTKIGCYIKSHFYVHNTQSLTHFSSAPHRNIFSEIGMRVMSKNIPNLQVYEHPPATPTTLSIKVVIVVLY